MDGSARRLITGEQKLQWAAYATEHNIYGLFGAITESVLKEQPADLVDHMIHFLRNEVDSETSSRPDRPADNSARQTSYKGLKQVQIWVYGPDSRERHAIGERIAKNYKLVHVPLLDTDSVEEIEGRMREWDTDRKGVVMTSSTLLAVGRIAKLTYGSQPHWIVRLDHSDKYPWPSPKRVLTRTQQMGEEKLWEEINVFLTQQ